ncbi:hypothetical protein EL18_02861 [Nitratireductor basaltis]|jgi:hypothetical protein|uniref:Uncharacterized protein n=1 Tax=Nitratireductor basaltis TaxID=472175 RepID=A0A084U6M2_9HYPH|nr:hypothetical protein EL18_02861 [Nitratireductor basaltis]
MRNGSLELFYEILYIPGNHASGRRVTLCADTRARAALNGRDAWGRTAEMTVPAPFARDALRSPFPFRMNRL